MENEYNFKEIEKKWQEKWSKNPEKAVDFDERPKHYHLLEFPYPSGAGLHVGHCMSYGASDAYCRMKRMQDFNVLFPMGWDAFGLPTENYAIKNKIKPQKATADNIKTFKDQMNSIAYSFDWDREVDTTDPDYFKWTQWIFLQFYKHAVVDGKLIEVADDDKTTPRLAYQAEMPINWCPSCKIGLANEEVINGKCERCGTETIKKMQKQWMMRITSYADRLISDLDTVDYLPKIKTQQINWIGKSTGTNVKFPIKSEEGSTVLLIDGLGGDGTSNWFPWLKSVLEKQGVKVLNPNLPSNNRPNYKETIEALKDVVKDVRGKISIVAHSLGAVSACSLISETGLAVEKMILVGPAETNTSILDRHKGVFNDDVLAALGQFVTDSKIDWDKVNSLVNESYLYFSDNDPYIPAEIKGHYKELKATTRDFVGKGHFNAKFGVTELPEMLSDLSNSIEVFTTRVDTLYGCTYVVIAPESEYMVRLKDQVKNIEEVNRYIEEAKKKSDLERTELQKDKTGVKLEGVKAINPINNEEVEVYIADYVLATYGTGAVMAVPAHDERDWEFARKYNILVKEVIIPVEGEKHDNEETRQTVTAIVPDKEGKNFLMVYWNEFGWYSPSAGGVDAGETPENAVVREVFEETGYRVEPVEKMGGQIEMHFYADNKKVWRERFDQPILCRLVDEKQYEVSEDESKRHKAVWLTYDEVMEKTTHKYNTIGFERFKKNNYAFTDYGVLINSNGFDGLTSAEAKVKITEKLKEIGSGDFTINYKLRDWVFSRQHYWGEPIPIVHCPICGAVPMDGKDLPLTLPDVENYEPTDTGESPLASIDSWVNTTCPKCGGAAKRETDTMPNWAGSSWYFLRYPDARNSEEFASKDKLKYWTPVDLYNGGMEHTTLHLLYSRFWHKFLYDLGTVPTLEPYQKRIAHGIILGPDGRKMSKSFGNVINPDDTVKEFGADTLRAYVMFIGPYDQESAWSMAGVQGIFRFLTKLYRNIELVKKDAVDPKDLLVKLNQTIKGVSEDIENFRFNTVVAKFMEMNNFIEKTGSISKESYEKLLKILFPVIPHLASELLEKIGNSSLLSQEKWPEADTDFLIGDTVELVIQVNGKVRDRISIKPDISKEEMEKMALGTEKIKAFVADKEITKVIVIPGRLVNIVIK